MDERKISLCIPTWNRVDMLIESFSNVLDDERISDIFISDDASDIEIFNQVKSIIDALNQTYNNKITLCRNLTNQDCFINKHHAILGGKQEFCIILDSDNVIGKDYLDAIYKIPEWDKHTSYMPVFAAPTFIYEEFSGLTISKENVAKYMDKRFFSTMLNCFNFFINREEYLKVFKIEVNPHTADSLFFNYCWFEAGNKMYVTPELIYQHRIHSGSHYQTFNHLTGNFYNEIEQKIKAMK